MYEESCADVQHPCVGAAIPVGAALPQAMLLFASLFSQGQQESLLVHISMVIQSMIPNLHCGQFSCSCVGTLGGKVSELSAPVFC